MTSLYAQGKHEEVSNMMNYSMLFNSLITFPTVVGMLLTNKDFVQLFLGNGYAESTIAINIIIFSLIPISFSEIVGRQTLIPTNNVKYFTASVVVGAFFSIVLNAISIPFWGYIGAAVTIVIVETIVCICMAYFARSFLNIRELLLVAIKPLICSLLTGILVFYLSTYIDLSDALFSLILKIVLFIPIYGLLIILTKIISRSDLDLLKKR